jgi:hypothetical protein
MKKLLLVPVMALALFVGAAAAPAKTPVFGTEDSCAASFSIENAQACGSNPTPYIVHCSYNSSTGHYFVGWSDGRWYYNPNGCW